MNSDRQQSWSKHPVQRLDRRQGRTAAHTSTNRRPAGDAITYQDSKGRDLEPDDEGDYDDAFPSRLPNSAIRYQRLADVLTEEPPRAGKSVVPPRSKVVQHLPPGVVLVQGVPCTNVGGQWVEVVFHHNQQPPAKRNSPQRQTEEHVPFRDDAQPQRCAVEVSRFHWLVWVGLALCTMWVGYVILTFVGNWLQARYDDAVYGRPRTYQTDAVVGHSDSPTNPSHYQCLNLNKRIQVIEFPGGDSSKSRV